MIDASSRNAHHPMRIWCIAWLMCLQSALFAPMVGASAGEPETSFAHSIAAWISDLGSEAYEVRRKAQEHLLAAGREVLSALKAAVSENQSVEIRDRAEKIVNTLTASERIERNIQEAIQDLGSVEWKTVERGLSTLIEEIGQGHGAEEALKHASAQDGASGYMAKAIWEPLKITILTVQWNPCRRAVLFPELPVTLRREAQRAFDRRGAALVNGPEFLALRVEIEQLREELNRTAEEYKVGKTKGSLKETQADAPRNNLEFPRPDFKPGTSESAR